MRKISVIMPSYLGDYEGAASMRELKFLRAVASFLDQNYDNKELIIVSDGCEKTIDIASQWSDRPEIRVFKIEKQKKFSGVVRNTGLEKGTGEIICYLDTDDYFGSNHLSSIDKNFIGDVCYFDDYVMNSQYNLQTRNVKIQFGSLGTSAIAHRSGLECKWIDGYGHDFVFFDQLRMKYKTKKITAGNYIVCHVPNQLDV